MEETPPATTTTGEGVASTGSEEESSSGEPEEEAVRTELVVGLPDGGARLFYVDLVGFDFTVVEGPRIPIGKASTGRWLDRDTLAFLCNAGICTVSAEGDALDPVVETDLPLLEFRVSPGGRIAGRTEDAWYVFDGNDPTHVSDEFSWNPRVEWLGDDTLLAPVGAEVWMVEPGSFDPPTQFLDLIHSADVEPGDMQVELVAFLIPKSRPTIYYSIRRAVAYGSFFTRLYSAPVDDVKGYEELTIPDIVETHRGMSVSDDGTILTVIAEPRFESPEVYVIDLTEGRPAARIDGVSADVRPDA